MTVTLTFLATGDRVEVELLDKSGKELGHVEGTFAWHTETEKRTNAYGGLDPAVYPRYIVLRCNGIVEIVEQREFGGPFYINDDPALRMLVGS